MNTKEKAIAAVLFAVLLGLIFFWKGPEPKPEPQKPGTENASNGKNPEPGGETPGTGTETNPKIEPADPKPEPVKDPDPKTDVPPEKPAVKLIERFADLQPASKHALIIDRSTADQNTDPLAIITVDPERGGIVEAKLRKPRIWL